MLIVMYLLLLQRYNIGSDIQLLRGKNAAVTRHAPGQRTRHVLG